MKRAVYSNPLPNMQIYHRKFSEMKCLYIICTSVYRIFIKMKEVGWIHVLLIRQNPTRLLELPLWTPFLELICISLFRLWCEIYTYASTSVQFFIKWYYKIVNPLTENRVFVLQKEKKWKYSETKENAKYKIVLHIFLWR